MQLLDLTLPTAAENVALDEALLATAEESATPCEILRWWEPTSPAVVMGRSTRADAEVQLDACAADGVPVVRRTSGGASIVTGPGCLMYALVLSYEIWPELVGIDRAHHTVLDYLTEALRTLVPDVACSGTSDLVIATKSPAPRRKFSGNSLRCKRRHLLYHGTLLYDFDLTLVERYLKHPPREPDYRGHRAHGDFVTNLPATAAAMRSAVTDVWRPTGVMTDWPRAKTAQLVAEKYALPAWNIDGRSEAP